MSTGREKIEAAISTQGTAEIPAVICYEGIYTRDHWEQLFDFPWWYSVSPDLDQQLAWRSQLIEKTGQDWFYLPACDPDEIRQDLAIEEQAGKVYLVNRITGEASLLAKPVTGGWREAESLNPVHPQDLPLTFTAVQKRIPPPETFDPILFKQSGQDRLAKLLLEHYGHDYYPIGHATGPQWGCYNIWGFEDWMMLVATDPELVRFTSQCQLAWSLVEIQEAAALGARGIWIEDCMVDMISRRAFEAINLPLIQVMVEEIRRLGMQSIYYYCGDPKGKLDLLLETERGCPRAGGEQKRLYDRYPGGSRICGWALCPAGKPGCHPPAARCQRGGAAPGDQPAGPGRLAQPGALHPVAWQPGDTWHHPSASAPICRLSAYLGAKVTCFQTCHSGRSEDYLRPKTSGFMPRNGGSR